MTSSVARKEIPRDTPLPVDFQPSESSVICGRGRDHYRHVGNRRFRALLLQHRENYVSSSSRARRSMIILDLVHYIRKSFQEEENRPNSLGAFVRRDRKTGRWYDVGDACAKEKVGHTLRDPSRTKDVQSSSLKKRKSSTPSLNIVSPSPSPSLSDVRGNYMVQRQQQLLSAMMQPTPLPCFEQSMNVPSNNTFVPDRRCDDELSLGDLSLSDIDSFFSSDEDIDLDDCDELGPKVSSMETIHVSF